MMSSTLPGILPIFPLIIILHARVSSSTRSASDRGAGTFKEDIFHLANDMLGLDQFQAHVDQQTYTETTPNGEQLVRELALSLKNKFDDRNNAVKALKTAIETFYNNYPERAVRQTRCCDSAGTEANKRFGNQKTTLEICTHGGNPSSTGDIFLADEVLAVMKSNLQNSPSIKWQYFGNEEGLLAVYPASKHCDDEYDPRFRPWYVETATPEPKDVVIVIDTSGSMVETVGGQSLMEIAKRAATTVINTLNPNDRVGVVAFSSNAYLPPGSTETSTCYETQLATANPENQRYLTKYVSTLSARGSTMYSKAFEAAFQYFIRSALWDDVSGQRDQVILFLTDGEASDSTSEIHTTISTENARMKNKVIIMTYGIGGVLDGSDGSLLLQEIAAQSFSDPSAGPITAGTFTSVADPTNLRFSMASFYNFFKSLLPNPKPAFSVPYIDAFGIGLLSSVCLPVMYSNKLKGVTCVDITMADLVSDVTYFRKGGLSYAFLIDGRGRVMTHPLLPRPLVVTDDPIYLKMTQLEKASQASTVMKSMIAGNTGSITMPSTRVQAKGDVKMEGVTTQTLQSDYYWQPVSLLNDGYFSLCVVLEKNDKLTDLVWTNPYPSTFTYHRLDLKPQPGSCKHFDRLALQNTSTVKLTADAFLDPFGYAESDEILYDVKEYIKYFTGASNRNPGLKNTIRNTVALTAIFDEIINGKKTPDSLIWTYIGTEDGVFRIMPGVQSPHNYDHKLRPWYLRPKSQSNLLTLSTPYIDAFGSGLVITLSHVIHESGNTNARPVGVMAIDFPMTYIYNLLMQNFPECKDTSLGCFIMDNSGFLVLHEDFIKTYEDDDIQNIHISMAEPALADLFVRAKHLKQESCVNYERIRYQHFTTMALTQSVVTSNYEIHPVANTNIFIVIKKKDITGQCHYSADQQLTSLSKCTGSACECPCYNPLTYNYCKEIFTVQSGVPCTPRLPEFDYSHLQQIEEQSVHDLQVCHDYKCHEKESEIGCLEVVTCFWCGLADPESSSKGSCLTRQECHLAEGESRAWIAGVIIGVLAMLVCCVLTPSLASKCCKNKKRVATPAASNNAQSNYIETRENFNRSQNTQQLPLHNIPPQGLTKLAPHPFISMSPQGLPPRTLPPLRPPLHLPQQQDPIAMHSQGYNPSYISPGYDPNVTPSTSTFPPPANIYHISSGSESLPGEPPPSYNPTWVRDSDITTHNA